MLRQSHCLRSCRPGSPCPVRSSEQRSKNRTSRKNRRINRPIGNWEGTILGMPYATMKPQNKTSQTRLSPGTLVEQPLPRKFVQKHSSEETERCEWHERATHFLNVYRSACPGTWALLQWNNLLWHVVTLHPQRRRGPPTSALLNVASMVRVSCGKTVM